MNKTNPINLDLDIFDQGGIFKIHLATAGGHIPYLKWMDSSHHEFRYKVKNKENDLKFRSKLNPALAQILTLKSDFEGTNPEGFNTDAYTTDFIGYAQRGLFSFDRTFVSDTADFRYHMVAYPDFDDNYNYFIRDLLNLNYHIDNYKSLNAEVENIVRYELNRPISYHTLKEFLLILDLIFGTNEI